MTFNELVNEVYLLTNRPDLESETKSAVKSAALKAHMTDFYSRDLYETKLTLEEASNIQSIDIHSIIPNFRSLNYIRIVDSTGAPMCMLDIISPQEILDQYTNTRVNVAYMAGRAIEVRSAVEFSNLIVGCYVLPIITEANFSSWVGIQFPYAIVQEAARVVFKTIGYDEQSRAYEQLVAEQYNLLKSTALADEAI